MSTQLKRFIGLLALVSGLAALLASPAARPADCKGLSMARCKANDACTWVKPYTTKTGKTVDAYCRAKPNRGTKARHSESDRKAAATTAGKSQQVRKEGEKRESTESGKDAMKDKKEAGKTAKDAKKDVKKKTEKKKSEKKKSDKKKSDKKKTDKKKSDKKKSDKKNN